MKLSVYEYVKPLDHHSFFIYLFIFDEMKFD